MRIPSIRRNSTHLSNPMNETPELAQQRQMQQNQPDSQQQEQRPKLRIGTSIKPKNRKQMPTLQGVTKKTPPSTPTNVLKSIRKAISMAYNSYLMNNPQLQARMSPQSTGDNNVDLTTSPQSIIAAQSPEERHTTVSPSTSSSNQDQHGNDLPTNQDNFQQELLRAFTERSETINMRIPSNRQNSTHLSNPMNETPELAQQRQLQQNQLDSQQQQQRPKLRIGTSIKPKNRKQMSTLQAVTKKTLPPTTTNVSNSIPKAILMTHNSYLMNNPQLQAIMSPQSTGDNNVDLTTSPQNIIASERSNRQNTETSGRPIYQSSRIQLATAHENGNQNLRTQEQLVDQSTETNSKTKRVPFMAETHASISPVTGSYLNFLDRARQADECMVGETLSPHRAVTSASDCVTDQEVFSDHEMPPNEAPAETTNNAQVTTNDSICAPADKPTAAPNSTARSHQINQKFILEQQMLDYFATLFTQMGATLRHTTDMYNTLRSSIFDTAEKYKKLLGAVEQFNTVRNTGSSASSSSNPIPEVPQSPEERHTKVSASASSSNQDQHGNDVANNKLKQKRRKFVLPPEYDAYDTKWTLKYRTNLPGLVELMPQSRVYVSYGDLKYCQHVSKDCKSLARRLLLAVFNRNALSVCSSMREKAQASNNVGSNMRPDLDDHACSVLLNFVLRYGLKRGWNTDLKPILSTLHSKMEKIRFEYSVTVEC